MSYNLTAGQRFNRLTVIEYSYSNDHGERVWKCKCDCGNISFATSHNLVSGHTKSCGCYVVEQTTAANTTHGKSRSRIYRAYSNMITRCYNHNYKCYASYGGRGIRVCDEWRLNAKSFIDWAIANGYREDLTLDRIDVNGDYCPENCRWATMKEQQNNRTNNAIYQYNGESKTLAEWADALGIKYNRLQMSIKRNGGDLEKAVRKIVG